MVTKLIHNASNGLPIEYKESAPVCLPPTRSLLKTPTLNLSKSKKDKKQNDTKKKTTKNRKSATTSKKSNKRSSKGKKGKKADTIPPKFEIPGEIFFTEPDLSIYRLQNANSSITEGYIVTTLTNLMTKSQKYYLNPLVIKIKKISNLPIETLKKHGYVILNH